MPSLRILSPHHCLKFHKFLITRRARKVPSYTGTNHQFDKSITMFRVNCVLYSFHPLPQLLHLTGTPVGVSYPFSFCSWISSFAESPQNDMVNIGNRIFSYQFYLILKLAIYHFYTNPLYLWDLFKRNQTWHDESIDRWRWNHFWMIKPWGAKGSRLVMTISRLPVAQARKHISKWFTKRRSDLTEKLTTCLLSTCIDAESCLFSWKVNKAWTFLILLIMTGYAWYFHPPMYRQCENWEQQSVTSLFQLSNR